MPRSRPRIQWAVLVGGLFSAACALVSSDPRDAGRRALPRESVRSGALELSYLRGGDADAPRVVFVHGTPGSARAWADYLVDPPPGLEAVAVDRPGFGLTTPRAPLPALEDQARALEPLLVSRRGQAPILVGHSLGAPVVAQAAIAFPDRVGALVLVAGSLDPDLEHVFWIQRFGRWSRLDWLVPSWARHSNVELIELESHLRSLAPRLAELRCPVVIVHGTEDRLVPYANVDFMRERLAANPRVELLRLEGADHFLPWNAEAEVRAGIERARALALP